MPGRADAWRTWQGDGVLYIVRFRDGRFDETIGFSTPTPLRVRLGW